MQVQAGAGAASAAAAAKSSLGLQARRNCMWSRQASTAASDLARGQRRMHFQGHMQGRGLTSCMILAGGAVGGLVGGLGGAKERSANTNLWSLHT